MKNKSKDRIIVLLVMLGFLVNCCINSVVLASNADEILDTNKDSFSDNKDEVTVLKSVVNGSEFKNKVFINEIMVNASDGSEWVEIYNNTDEAVDLTDWTIKDDVNPAKNILTENSNSKLGAKIESKSFYVFEFVPDPKSFPSKGWLNNKNSERVTIFDSAGLLVDVVEIDLDNNSDIKNYPKKNETVGRIEDGENEIVLFTSSKVTKGYSNSQKGKVVFKSYVCPFYFKNVLSDSSTKNSFKPNDDGDVDYDLSTCKIEGGYNFGHGGKAVKLPAPEYGEYIGTTDASGFLEAELKIGKYMFGELDSESKWIGYGDEKDYNANILGLACTGSSDGGFRDNNAEAVTLEKDKTIYCNLYVVDPLLSPIQTGFNKDECDECTLPNEDISCSGEIVNNKVAVHWLDVTSENINSDSLKYQVQYSSDKDNWTDNFKVYSNPYTDYSFFDENVSDGKYYSRVRTFNDENKNNEYDLDEEVSEWSNVCDITFDKTEPEKILDLTIYKNEKNLGCSSTIGSRTIIVDWEGVDDVDFYNYELKGKEVFKFDSSQKTIQLPNEDGEYKYRVQAVDEAGNLGEYSDWCGVTLDSKAPVLTETKSTESLINDNTFSYKFNSDESGYIIYEGSCVGNIKNAVAGENVITFENLADGVYADCTISVKDEVGNLSNVLEIPKFAVDTEKPVVTKVLDQIFYEGEKVPELLITGVDNFEVKRFCYSFSEDLNKSLLGNICLESGLTGTSSWNIFEKLPTVFDTSIISEGKYRMSYYVEDSAGNRSDNQSFVFELKNVSPNVDLIVSDKKIRKNKKVSFEGAFRDPSSKDAGDGVADDSEWYAFINYGEGNDVYLGSYLNESSIVIPDHKYKHKGAYVAKLTVCESKSNILSEQECGTQEISIKIKNKKKKDKKDEDDSDESGNTVEINDESENLNNSNYDNSFVVYADSEEELEEIVEEKDFAKKDLSDNESKEKVKEKSEKTEIKGIVAGEQICHNKFLNWFWILLSIIFGIFIILIGYNNKSVEENISSIFWQGMLMIGMLIIWFFFDYCRNYYWFPILILIGGLATILIFYKNKRTS